MKYPLIWFVKFWRTFISPAYGVVCKFHPTCSAYSLTALETHGALKGSALSIGRIVRCHPWSQGGVDYVPGTPQAEAWARENSSTPDEASRKAEVA